MIYKVDGKTFNASKFARTLGRPLGLKFDSNGSLIVADADFGLLSVDKQGRVSQLCSESEGVPFKFADFVEIGEDGAVYFSDASRHPYHKTLVAVVDGVRSGRVLKYDPKKERCELVADNLQFPNGMVLTDGGKALLVAELSAYRIWKIQLEGSNKGKRELWLETPGMPDNLQRGSNGIIYVGMGVKRDPVLEKYVFILASILFWKFHFSLCF